MNQQQDAEQSPQPFRALILNFPTAEAFTVGSVELPKRWEIGLSRLGATPEFCASAAGMIDRLDTNSPTLLVWGDWAADPLVTEEMMGQINRSCGANEVISFTAPGMALAPLLCIGSEAACTLANIDGQIIAEGSEAVLLTLKQDSAISNREVSLKGGFWMKVTSRKEAKRATWKMLWQLQWRPGGVVAKYLNRPVSIPLSYLLMNTPVTPNITTFVAFVVGAIGVAALFMGGYWNVVLAGILLQTNSVLDGIDGELARIRLKTSDFGAYFDSVCDEILNALLFIGIGYDLSRTTGVPYYLYIGLFTGVMAFLYSLTHWHCKWKHGLGLYWWFEAYKPRKQVQQSTSFFSYFKKLFWKESYLFIFMVSAFFSFQQILLWIALPAATAVFVLLFIHIIIKRARW